MVGWDQGLVGFLRDWDGLCGPVRSWERWSGVDAGFGEALIGALAGGGVAVARHEVARLVRGCLDRLRGRGRAADELVSCAGDSF